MLARRVLAVALLAAGCAAPSMSPISSSGEIGISDAALSADGRTVTLVIRGADFPSSGAACTGSYRLKNWDVDGSVITATGWAETYQPADMGCALVSLVCCEYKFDVPVDPPFSVTELRVPNSPDSKFPFLHKLLVRPPSVPTLANLDGWRLVREGSTLSPTRQWQQTYVPAGAPTDGQERLELNAALEGSVVGTDPSAVKTIVTVNGAKAALMTFAETHELQLVWRDGDVSMALDATATDFTAHDLIAIAEAATASP